MCCCVKTCRIESKKLYVYYTYTYNMEYTLNITKWLIILVILSILGLNIFNYLANLTNVAGGIAKAGIKTGLEGTKKTINLTGKGTSKIAGGLEKGVDALEKALDIKVIDGSVPSQSEPGEINLKKKSGYCFIGTDRGNRSCIYVGKGDTCMSGDIFPTMDVCINPKLRV